MRLIIFILVSSCFAAEVDLLLKAKFYDYTYEAYGKLIPRQISKVAANLGAKVIFRSVEVGQFVKKDQLLFELDPGTIPLEINQIDIDVNKQKLQLSHHQNRYDRRKKNIAAYTEEGLELEKLHIDRLTLEIEKLNAKREIHQLMLSYKNVKAPFDGIITKSFVEVGDWVMLGGSTALIQSTDLWKLETEVPWNIYSQLTIGDVAFITKGDLSQAAQLIAKVPIVNSRTDQYRIELSFSSKNWQPSQFEVVPVSFLVKKRQLEIPMQYVKKELGVYQVKTFETTGFRWLSTEGIARNGFFYPNNLDLENRTLKSIK